MTSDLSPVDRLAGFRSRVGARDLFSALEVGWLLERIQQLQGEIDRRNTPWQHSDLWGRLSAADPEIREALIQAWNERDQEQDLRLAACTEFDRQRRAVLSLCDKVELLPLHYAQTMDLVRDLRATLGVDRD